MKARLVEVEFMDMLVGLSEGAEYDVVAKVVDEEDGEGVVVDLGNNIYVLAKEQIEIIDDDDSLPVLTDFEMFKEFKDNYETKEEE